MVLDDVYLETSGSTATGGSATLRGNFTEESPDPDRLVGVTTPVATTVELPAPDGSPTPAAVTVPGDGAVDATTGPVLIRLTGLRGPLSPQVVVPVTFEFATAGRVTIDDVPVRRSGPGGEPTSLRLPAVGAGGTPYALVTPAP
jgi:copper(I)-binding protein